MADVKIMVAERGGVELDALEEASPTTDVILAKGLKTAATDLTLEDGANGSVTLTEVLKIRVSSNDTTPGYLLDKLIAGTGVTLTEVNNGADEDIRIAADALTLDDLTDILIDSAGPQPGDVLVYDGSSGLWMPAAPSADTDKLVRVSSNDTTSGYLLGKLTTGTGVTLTEINDAGDEDLQIGLSLGAIDHDLLLNFVADEHVGHSTVSVVAGGDDALAVTNNDLTTNIGLTVDIVGTTAETVVASGDSFLFHDLTPGALRSVTFANLVTSVESIINLSLNDITDVLIDSAGPQPGDILIYDGSSGLWLPGAPDLDDKVAVSANDTTPGFLLGKLTAGTGVTLTEVGDGGDEDLQVGLSLGAIDHDQLLNFVADEHVAHSGVSVVAGGDDALAVTNNDLSSNIGLTVDILGTTTGTPVGADLLLFHDIGVGLRSATISTIVGASVTAFGVVTGDTGTATADGAADTLQIEGATAGGIVTTATDGPELLTIELDISDLATDAGPLVATDTFALDDGTAANKKVTLSVLGSSISPFINLTIEDLTDVVIDSPGAQPGDILVYDGSSGTWMNMPLNTMDELIKISSNDTTSGYLFDKVVAGTGIALAELNDAGDEDLQVSLNATADDLTDVVYDSAGPQTGDILEWTGAAWEPMAPGGATAFGDEFLSVQNVVEASTTSTTPIQRLSISATGMTASYTYIVKWSYTWRYTSTANDFMARIDQDNGTILWTHDQEPKDTASTQRAAASGFALVTGLSGSHTFDLDWWSESASQSAFIYNARMAFWRVS